MALAIPAYLTPSAPLTSGNLSAVWQGPPPDTSRSFFSPEMQSYFEGLTTRGLVRRPPALFNATQQRVFCPPGLRESAQITETRRPPATHEDPIVHADPFRWLETDSPERDRWLSAQNAYSKRFFRGLKCHTRWESIFRNLFNEPNVIKSVDLGDLSIELIDRGLNKPTELVVKKGGKEIKTLFSTHSLARNGTAAATSFEIDPNQKYVILPVSRRGSIDNYDLYVINIRTGKTLEIVKNARGNGWLSWLSADTFKYNRLVGRDEITLIHKLGSSRDGIGQDRFLETNARFFNSKDRDVVFRSTPDNTWVKAMSGSKWKRLNVVVQRDFGQIGDERLVEIKHNGKTKLAKLTLNNTTEGQARAATVQVVHEAQEDAVIKNITRNEDHIVIHYAYGKKQWLEVLKSDGTKENAFDLPDCFSITHMDFVDKTTLTLTLTSNVIRKKDFKFDIATGLFVDADPQTEMTTDEKGQVFVTEYVEVVSKDGTKVPVRLTYKKGLVKNGQNPVLIEGYGGFNVPGHFYPAFSTQLKHFIDHGGVYVAPALRGGNELGESWHKQGMKEKKQNVFNDLFATAEFLIKDQLTQPKKIAAMGWSNGGLLMAVAATQRPDLFGLIIAGNGVHDMLRRDNLDPEFNDGWAYEYGHTQDPRQWPYFEAYSPVHNARPSPHMPTVLVLVGRNDSRVDPAHSYKFAAALQKVSHPDQKILLSSMPNAGHWMTYEDLQDLIGWCSNARIWSTIFETLGMEVA
ncbi:MAG: S9 family peptidase [Deltaproteobacteria bacterium]|nr:S9 family peptidase [Deltaproteobacteria bacterium]